MFTHPPAQKERAAPVAPREKKGAPIDSIHTACDFKKLLVEHMWVESLGLGQSSLAPFFDENELSCCSLPQLLPFDHSDPDPASS